MFSICLCTQGYPLVHFAHYNRPPDFQTNFLNHDIISTHLSFIVFPILVCLLRHTLYGNKTSRVLSIRPKIPLEFQEISMMNGTAFWGISEKRTITQILKIFSRRGRFPFNQRFRKFRNGDKWYGNFLGKFPENLEIVEFLQSEPFNRKFNLKFWKFWVKVKWNGNCQ